MERCEYGFCACRRDPRPALSSVERATAAPSREVRAFPVTVTSRPVPPGTPAAPPEPVED